MSVRDIVQAAAGSSVADASDPYFKNVSLLLSGDGTNGAQNNTFLDSSTNNFTITRNGNTTQGSFSPYGSNWGNYFNGSSYLSVADNSGLRMGSGDFTMECWANQTSLGSLLTVFGKFTGGVNDGPLLFIDNGVPTFYWGPYSGSSPLLTGGTVAVGAWAHLAVVRSGNTFTMYVNGSSVASASSATSDVSTSPFTVGWYNGGGSRYFNGYISNVRIVKGTAVYTSAFTPSTTPLTAITNTSLLTCQSNRFIDNSANKFGLTVSGTPSVQRFSPFAPKSAYSTSVIGGSGYFDGGGDIVYTTGSTLSIGTGDFTAEAWWYPTAGPLQEACFISLGDPSTSNGFCLVTDNSRGLFVSSANGYATSGWGFIPKLNEWNHVAVTRSGGIITTWLNGSACQSVGNSNYFTGYIGVGKTVNGWFTKTTGYIAGARILNTVLYTTNFTPPTTVPTSSISGTQFLCNFTNASVIDAAMMNDLETVGNAQISTAVKKYGTGSMYFDGIGDWLLGKSPTTLNFGTGDFTVEAWVNFSPFVSTYPQLLSSNASAAPQFAFTSTTIYYYNGAVTFSGNYTWSTGVWYHVAWTRQNGTFRMFVNGTSVYSGSISDNITSTDFMVGAYAGGASNGIFAGYIDDLRITKGIARYTANFTPPAQALPTNG